MNPNLIKFFLGGGGGTWGRGARVSDFFITKNPICSKFFLLFLGEGGGGWARVNKFFLHRI